MKILGQLETVLVDHNHFPLSGDQNLTMHFFTLYYFLDEIFFRHLYCIGFV